MYAHLHIKCSSTFVTFFPQTTQYLIALFKTKEIVSETYLHEEIYMMC